MPSLKAVRTRIASVKSTQKITRAMKLVAAAKLRRAQDAILAARPYANALSEAVSELAARAGDAAHPMLAEREPRRVALVAITSDRGLAGGFNANVGRASLRFISEHKERGAQQVQLLIVGRKGREFARRRKLDILRELAGAASDTAFERAREVANIVTDDFGEGRVDAVYLAYNEFKSAISQRVVTIPLLPVKPPPPTGAGADRGDRGHEAPAAGGRDIDFLYEPSKEALLSQMLPMYIRSQIYRAMLESIASEFGARMSAMENATKAATEMIDRLTLQYNRARQASITKELMEIVGGAEALKG
jgi:F-type H+-transporting ATPase subunit gamma